MENKENTANIQGESVNKLWGEPSKVRRSVLKEFDPLASKSPIPTPKKPVPVVHETIDDDEDIFEDAETSLPAYESLMVDNGVNKATPSRRTFGLRESLLIPELKDLRPIEPRNQSFGDTGELLFMECAENVAQINNSRLEVTASDDSVEFNYNARKSIQDSSFNLGTGNEQTQSYEKTSSIDNSLEETKQCGQNCLNNVTTEHEVFRSVNSSFNTDTQQGREIILESHEIVFVNTNIDNATLTDDYDPLGMPGTEVPNDPLCVEPNEMQSQETEASVDITVLETCEKILKGEDHGSECLSQKKLSLDQSLADLNRQIAHQAASTDHPDRVSQTFNETSCEQVQECLDRTTGIDTSLDDGEQIKESDERLDVNFKAETCPNETLEMVKVGDESSDIKIIGELFKRDEAAHKSSPNVHNQLDQTFERAEGPETASDEEDLIAEPRSRLNPVIEVSNLLGSEKSVEEGDLANRPRVCLNETVRMPDPEEMLQIVTRDLQNQFDRIVGPVDAPATARDNVAARQKCLNQITQVTEVDSSLIYLNQSDKSLDKGDSVVEPAVCLKSAIKATKAEEISLNSSHDLQNQLNRTFDQAAESEKGLDAVVNQPICLNSTIEVIKDEEISYVLEHKLNQTFDQAAVSEKSIDNRSSVVKPPVCLNSAIKATKAEEISHILEDQLNQTFELADETAEAAWKAKDLSIKPHDCLNQTLEVAKANSSLLNAINLVDHVVASKTTLDGRDVNNKLPVCLNETIEVANTERISQRSSVNIQNRTIEKPDGPSTTGNEKDLKIELQGGLNQVIDVDLTKSSTDESRDQAEECLDAPSENFEEPMDVSYGEENVSIRGSVDSNSLISQASLNRSVESTNSEAKNQLNYFTIGHLKEPTECPEEPMDVSFCENESADQGNAKVTRDCLLGQMTKIAIAEGSFVHSRTFDSNQSGVQHIDEQRRTSNHPIEGEDLATIGSVNETIQMVKSSSNALDQLTETFEQANRLADENSDIVYRADELNATSTKESNQTVSTLKDSTSLLESAATDQSLDKSRRSMSGRRSVNFCSVISTDLPIDSSSTFAEDDEEAEKAAQILAQSLNRTIDVEESAIVEEEISSSTDVSCNLDATFDANTKEAEHVTGRADDIPDNKSSAGDDVKPKFLNKTECRPNVRALRTRTRVIDVPTVLKAARDAGDEVELSTLEELKMTRDKLENEKSGLREELDELERDNGRKDRCILEHALQGEVWRDTLAKYRRISEQYERHLQMQTRELEQQKKCSEALCKDFASTEMAFLNAVQKYERAKSVIEAYQNNEEIMKLNLRNATKALFELEAQCQALKDENKRILGEAEKNLAQERADLKKSITSLQNTYKRLEIKFHSLEAALSEKTKECDALTALCDALTAGQS